MTKGQKVIAYFTPEVAIHQGIHTYTGGLGYLAGTYARAAFSVGLPAVPVAPLGRYYKQTIIETPQGKRMGIEDAPLHVDGLLELTDVEFPLSLRGGEVWVRVWRFPGKAHNSSDILFLDTNYDKNPEDFRAITRYLYGGFSSNGVTEERRIALTFVLGVGGVQALRALGYRVSVYHLNECHAVFAAVELLREQMEKKHSLYEAIQVVRQEVLFTTHTPVPAGIWRFNMDSVINLTNGHFQFDRNVFETLGRHDNDFSLGIAALRLATVTNAVSKRHKTTMERMWAWVLNDGGFAPITSVTNGVCRLFWQHPRYHDTTSTAGLRKAKQACKRELLEYIHQVTGKYLGENTLTAVFTRRWTGYKRPLLILDKMETVGIERMLRHNQLQLIFAGFPNPDETEMVNAWNHVLALSESLPNIVILPGYDLKLSAILKAGADLWINTPAAPKEACGTSGMGANLNGALNLSTPDGWMAEVVDRQHHYLFGHDSEREWWRQWGDDASALRERLIGILARYYDEPDAWYEMAFDAMREAETEWSGERMIKDYMVLYDRLLRP